MRRALGVALCLLASGCFDFGVEGDLFDVPPPLDSGGGPAPADAGDDDGGTTPACVEGPTDPAVDGPQLHYLTLSVDQRTLTIDRGQVVTWTNSDSMRHSVVAGAPGAVVPPAQGGFDSGEFGAGAQWAYRFCNPRTVVYFCSTHPSQMNGFRIIVR
ncbi:MAG: hypothetical protein IT384_07730 [Deltaproteobacteria bacterium]|nr:hypothetical protein [Deltaproteobacteria bacterium]